MTQPELFDDDRYQPARRTDPDTSKEAAEYGSEVTELSNVPLGPRLVGGTTGGRYALTKVTSYFYKDCE